MTSNVQDFFTELIFILNDQLIMNLTIISNLTISHGRDASFACSVRNLGGYKVQKFKVKDCLIINAFCEKNSTMKKG